MAKVEEKPLQYLLQIVRLSNNKPMLKVAGLTAILEIITSSQGTRNVNSLLQNDFVEDLIQCFESSMGKHGPFDNLILFVAIRITYHLSKFQPPITKSLMTEVVFSKLLKFVELNGPLFKFREDFKSCFAQMVLSKPLMANVKAVKITGDVAKHLVEDGIVTNHAQVPKFIHKCQCFDTSGEKDINISEALVAENLVWPSKDILPLEAECENWQDVIITKVIDKQYFYAIIGEESIQQMSKLTALMEEESFEFVPAVIETGKIVAASIPGDGGNRLHRGQVLNCHGDWVQVALVDDGGLEDVKSNQIFELPSSLGLMYFQPLVSLCFLEGIAGGPEDPYICQLALSSLVNLCRYSVGAGLMLMTRTPCMESMRAILRCPDDILILQALRVLNNLSSNPCSPRELFSDVLADILDLLKVLDVKNLSLKMKDDIQYAMVSCMANILHMDKEYRALFYQKEGVSMVLKILLDTFPSKPLSRLVKQLLRNFLFHSSRMSSGAKKPGIVGNKLEHNGSKVQTTVSPRPLAPVSNFEEIVHHQPVFPLRRQDSEESFITVDGDGLDDNLSQVKVVESSHVRSAPQNYYVYGSKVPFHNDVEHDLRPQTNLEDVSSPIIAEIACGMLNNSGGTIYFGITNDSEVTGVKVTRDSRDSLRLGVDQLMMRRLVPVALHMQINIIYIPVYMKRSSQRLEQAPDLFVVEIQIEPSQGTLHCVAITERYYYRYGGSNMVLSPKDVREMVVVREEAPYREEILSLRRNINSLRQRLATC